MEHVKGSVLMGRLGLAFNRASEFAYVSYVPDAIHDFGKMPQFRGAVDAWTRGNPRKNAGDVPRMLFLRQNAERVIEDGVPGDFAELGVHKGHSARLLADTISRVGADRRIYLFDTFDGFDARDLDGIDLGVPALFSDTSVEAVKSFVGNGQVCVYRPGYFPESADGIDAGTRFAFVHLDCDLYEPMRAALVFFYYRLSSGAFMVIHDYSSGHWPGATQAVDEFLENRPERLILMPDKSGTAIFRKE